MRSAADAVPACPTCDTDLLVTNTQFDGAYRCQGCNDTFGRDRRPVAWDAPDAWYVSSKPRGRTRAHADRECPDLTRVDTVLSWDARNARAAALPRCKRCSYTEGDS